MTVEDVISANCYVIQLMLNGQVKQWMLAAEILH